MEDVPGRKILVLLTAGLPMNNDVRYAIEAAVSACNKANVAIYPIDVRGLFSDTPGIGPGTGPGARPAAGWTARTANALARALGADWRWPRTSSPRFSRRHLAILSSNLTRPAVRGGRRRNQQQWRRLRRQRWRTRLAAVAACPAAAAVDAHQEPAARPEVEAETPARKHRQQDRRRSRRLDERHQGRGARRRR